jgi:hypothetical protein
MIIYSWIVLENILNLDVGTLWMVESAKGTNPSAFMDSFAKKLRAA